MSTLLAIALAFLGFYLAGYLGVCVALLVAVLFIHANV
jgi:hypothetical protein